MKLLLAVLVYGLIAFASCQRKFDDEKTTNCFIEYFKSVNMLRSDFPSFRSGAVYDECEEHINKHYQFNIRNFRLNNYPLCINSDAKVKNFLDPALLYALHKETADDIPWTTSDVETLKDNFVEKTISNIHSCTLDWAKDVYDEMLNSTIKTSIEMSEKGSKDDALYCFMKHLDEKNLLDIPVLKFDMNPKGLDTNETECERLIEEFTFAIDYHDFSQKEDDMQICKHVANFKPKYINLRMNHFVFQSLDTNSAHRIMDRHHFYEEINPLMKFFFVCTSIRK